MKLLIDLSTFGSAHKGGKDEVAYNLLRGFSSLGYVSQIICVSNPELKRIIHEIDPEYNVITIKRKKITGRIGNLLSSLLDISYGRKVRKIAKEQDCARILFTNKLSPIVKQRAKTYLIPHDIQFMHNLDNSTGIKLYTRIYVKLMKYSFRFCDKIIAISDFDKKEMIRYLPKYRDRIIRIYDPIQFKSVTPNTERKYITALNIQHPHKNTITLIKAYARIVKEGIKEDLILVGRKDFSIEVEAMINEIIEYNNLHNRIHFTGFVDEAELKTIIANTRIFVNPSLYEGFGMAAVEMMESKIPTIVANTSAQPEATLGLCRYYEPATDDIALAKVIMDELTHPTPESELDRIAEAVREKYNYVEIAKEYWDIIMAE